MKTFVLRQSDNALVMIEAPEKPNPDFRNYEPEEWDSIWRGYELALKQAIANGIKVADEDKIIKRILNDLDVAKTAKVIPKPKQENDMKQISEEIKKKIEERSGQHAHTFTKEHTANLAMKQMFSLVMMDGVSLMQEEVDRLQHNLNNFIHDDYVLRETIESQAKEIESKKEVIVNMSHDWQKQLTAKDKEIGELREALRFSRPFVQDLSLLNDIDNLLNDKK